MNLHSLNGAPEPAQLARRARLRYVSDEEPGYGRQVNGKGFVYVNTRGRRLRSERMLVRIEQLAIPPAWREVWICAVANGHLQATGRDDRKRKQYIYHERWRAASQLAKFWRLSQFGRVLPKLRQSVAADLRGRKLTRRRVLAGMVALLDATSIRVGNEEYVKENGSYGLATLRTRHVTVGRGKAELRFRGKGGLQREATVTDRRLVRLLADLQKLPGSRLFQFVDETGKICRVGAADVNQYLQDHTGQLFTAKDFRTWKASALVAATLYAHREAETIRERKKVLREAIAAAAAELGNTNTVCRKYYIHPWLFVSYEQGTFPGLVEGVAVRRRPMLRQDEQVLIRFLKKCDELPGAKHWSALITA